MEQQRHKVASGDAEWNLLEAAAPDPTPAPDPSPAPPTCTALPPRKSPAHAPAPKPGPAPTPSPSPHAPPSPSPSPTSRFLRALPSELLPRILSLLPPNDLAGSVRLVCRDALDACRDTLLLQHAALMPSVGATVPAPLCCCVPARPRPHHLAVRTAAVQLSCAAASPPGSGIAPAGTTANTGTSSSSAPMQQGVGSTSSSKACDGCPLCPRFVIHLSQPVPPALFAWRWAPRDATDGLTANQREELWRLTVATGVLQNVRQVLRCRTYTDVDSSRTAWQRRANITAAARRGNVELVRLLSRTCDREDRDAALQAAAAAGHTDVCCWLLSTRSAQRQWQNLDVRKSLFGHHDKIYPATARCLLVGAAAGFSVTVLMTLYGTFIGAVRGLFVYNTDRERTAHAMLLASATSTTPDWQAKAAWVLGEFFNSKSSTTTGSIVGRGQVSSSQRRLTPQSEVCTAVAALPGALPRLQWLQERGCPLDPPAVLQQVVCVSGDADVLTHLLQHHGVVPGPQEVQHAACLGHVEVLQVLLRNRLYGRGTAEAAPGARRRRRAGSWWGRGRGGSGGCSGWWPGWPGWQG